MLPAKAALVGAMARREASVVSASSVSGDDDGQDQHNMQPVVVSGPKETPDVRGGGGYGKTGRTFGVYNGSWGGRRELAQFLVRIMQLVCMCGISSRLPRLRQSVSIEYD